MTWERVFVEYVVSGLSFAWVIGWYLVFGYGFLANFLFDMIVVVTLGSLFFLLIILPKERRSFSLQIMGTTFLGAAILEFAHSLVYLGYITFDAELTVKLWIFSKIVLVSGLMLAFVVSTKALLPNTQKLIRKLSSLPLILSIGLLLLHKYIPGTLFYKDGVITPLKSVLELFFTSCFIFLALKFRKEPAFFLGAILNAAAHVMFFSYEGVFGIASVFGYAFMLSGLSILALWAFKKYLVLPFREADALAKRFGRMNDVSKAVNEKIEFLNAVINLKSELADANNEKELLDRIMDFISQKANVSFALFQEGKLIAKYPKCLPDSVEKYADFEKFKLLNMNAFLKSPDQTIQKLLEDLFLRTNILAQNIKNRNELGNLNQKIREQEEFRLNFQRSISHELKTPLNVISGNLQLIEMGIFGKNPNLSEPLQSMKNASKYMLELINNLMDLSRLETGRVTVESIPLKISDFEPIVAQYETLATQKGLEFKFQFSGRREFSGDYKLLSALLSNLLSNAIKYTAIRGKVKGYLEICEKKIVIEVSDTGKGIPKSKQEEIFEPFVSAEKRNMGTGLGLAIVKKFVDLLHGNISLWSVEGKGSTFKIELPRPELKYEPAAKGAIEESIDVLYIEYDPDTRKLIKKLLKEFTVEEACTGKEGFEKALALKPKIVITDLGLPDIDGRNLIIDLKTREELKNTNFLLYTGGNVGHTLSGIPVIEKGSDLQNFLLSIKILMGVNRLILTSNMVDSREVIKVKKMMNEIIKNGSIQVRNLDEIRDTELQLYDFIVAVLPDDISIISKVVTKMKSLPGNRVVLVFLKSHETTGE